MTLADSSWQKHPILIQPGRSWALVNGSPHSAVEVSSEGRFKLERKFGVAFAFLDTNQNGRLDAFQEPSGACSRDAESGSWHCGLRNAKVIVRTITRERDGEGKTASYAFAEAYGPKDAKRYEPTRLCEELRGRCASDEEPQRFLDAPTEIDTLWFCKEGEDAVPRAKVLTLETPRGSTEVGFPAKEPNEISVDFERVSRGYRLTAEGRYEPDRVLFWIGELDASGETVHRIAWTSEHGSKAVSITGRKARGFIPDAAIESCGADCTLAVQVVSLDTEGEHVQQLEAQVYTPVGELP